MATKGTKVTLVEIMDSIAADVERTSRLLLLFSLDEHGVKMLTKTTAKEIAHRGVRLDYRGRDNFIEADTVVLALGAQPNHELADQIKKLELNTELYVIGDCADIRRLAVAVEEGFKTALKI